MTPFYALLSPAKLMDESIRYSGKDADRPYFIEEASVIHAALKKLPFSALKKILATSDELTQQTADRIAQWNTHYHQSDSTLAIHLFQGEVYRGLNASGLDESAISFAHTHLGILSGMYGLLRAKDLVLPYRLMMGTRFAPTKTNASLYSFWNQKITERLNNTVDPDGFIVNLASDEYFKVIDRKMLIPQVVHCDFFEIKNGQEKMISTFAKQARGMMARYIIDERITSPAHLKDFNAGGYALQSKRSTPHQLVFSRSSQP
jgi:uncharacterized protein